MPSLLYKWILIFNFWGEWRGHSQQSLCDVDSSYINLDRILLDVEGMEERSKGKVMKNVKTTIIFILIFAAGFITASFLTHGYFKNAYESKVNQTLNQPNIPNE